MLQLRPNCECCNKDLLPSANDAYICSFECTFCLTCAKELFNFICPSCSGNLVERPVRPEKHLIQYPASTKRINKNHNVQIRTK